MAKRKTGWTEKKINKYIHDGRGQGELNHYRPWLTIQDVPSQGRSHRIKGWKTNRIHHLLSDLERDYFYLLEWSADVIDIREQYPLNRETTTLISEKVDLKHPLDPETKTPLVMTTDFLITIKSSRSVDHYARTLKYSSDLRSQRTLEKFEIERRYWAENNVDWGIVTDNEISKEISKNIAWLHNSRFLNETDEEYIVPFLKHLDQNRFLSIINILNQFEELYKCESGTALLIFKYLLARKIIKLDMGIPINLKMSADKVKITKQSESQERFGS